MPRRIIHQGKGREGLEAEESQSAISDEFNEGLAKLRVTAEKDDKPIVDEEGKNISDVIDVKLVRLKVEILSPAKEPMPIFYIGEKIGPLEAQAVGDEDIIKNINNEQEGFRFVWFVEQAENSATIHSGRKADISEAAIPHYFEQIDTRLIVVIYKNQAKRAYKLIDVQLIRRQLPPYPVEEIRAVTIEDLNVNPERATSEGIEYETPIQISTRVISGKEPFKAYCYIFRYLIDEKAKVRVQKRNKYVLTLIYPPKPRTKRAADEFQLGFDFEKELAKLNTKSQRDYYQRVLELTSKTINKISDEIVYSEKDFGNLYPGEYKVIFLVRDSNKSWDKKEVDIIIKEPGKKPSKQMEFEFKESEGEVRRLLQDLIPSIIESQRAAQELIKKLEVEEEFGRGMGREEPQTATPTESREIEEGKTAIIDKFNAILDKHQGELKRLLNELSVSEERFLYWVNVAKDNIKGIIRAYGEMIIKKEFKEERDIVNCKEELAYAFGFLCQPFSEIETRSYIHSPYFIGKYHEIIEIYIKFFKEFAIAFGFPDLEAYKVQIGDNLKDITGLIDDFGIRGFERTSFERDQVIWMSGLPVIDKKSGKCIKKIFVRLAE